MSAHGLKLGLAYRFRQSGGYDQAEQLYREILSEAPDSVEGHAQLAQMLIESGRAAEALAPAKRARELDADSPDACSAFAIALRHAGAHDAAEAEFRAALRLSPDRADVLINLADLLNLRGRFTEALALADQALAQAPDAAPALIARAAALRHTDGPAAAIDCFRRAMAQAPPSVEARVGLAVSLIDSDQIDDGIAILDEALALRPGDPELISLRGMARLLRADFGGFDDYQARWDIGKADKLARYYPGRRWDGEPLTGRSIYLWGDQGIGEEIMFGSMIGEIAASAGRCAVECDPRLVPILERSFPAAEVVARPAGGEPRAAESDWDYRAPVRALGRWLRPDRTAFGTPRAYLSADPAKSAAVKTRYQAMGPGPKIGIAWRSISPNAAFGATKSTELSDWAPILTRADATFFDLQYGETDADRQAVAETLGVTIHDDREIDQRTDLDGFAAQIAALDLVITTSNSTAHMAGALGRPTWVLLPFVPDWRWQISGESSLWYAGARLMRQAEPGDWPGVLARAGTALADLTLGGDD